MKLTKDNEPIWKQASGQYEIRGPVGRYAVGGMDRDTQPYYCIVSEVEAYLAAHPEALIPEPAPPEPTKEEQAAASRAQFAALDAAAIRPLRAIAAGSKDKGDIGMVAELESQAIELRAKL